MTAPNLYADECYAWIWLPAAAEPVLAGRLGRDGNTLSFAYADAYLRRSDAISIFPAELPLKEGPISPAPGLMLASCIRDAAPDAWGRRVLANQRFGAGASDLDGTDLDEISCLLRSGSDRIGALDFQSSTTRHTPRLPQGGSLDRLLDAADLVQRGIPLSRELKAALLPRCAVGGARPKALVADEGKAFIAKFSGPNDGFDIVKAEFLAMRLARLVGLEVAPVQLVRSGSRDVLLIERFDRIMVDGVWRRRALVSGLTLLGLDEMMARYASYQELATIIRHRFTDPKPTLRELFSRLVFNILCGNTNDHARNHAAFWNGSALSLTPAYDICPQGRTGREASQAMLIDGDRRFSQIAVCLDAAPSFLLSREEATAIAAAQISTIKKQWQAVCDEATLSTVDRELFWRRQFLNPFAFEGAPDELISLVAEQS